jgi:hypothetical protein
MLRQKGAPAGFTFDRCRLTSRLENKRARRRRWIACTVQCGFRGSADSLASQ